MVNVPTPWTAAGRATLRRRNFLRGTPAAAGTPSFLWGTATPDLVLIMMADLHSGYAYTPALLQAVRTAVSNSPNSATRIVVNGDVFEAGNSLSAMTSGPGAIDLAMIDALADLAPTIVTIGNHDGDLFDPQSFVSSLQALSAKHGSALTLVSDLGDTRRRNALYTGSAFTRFSVGDNPVVVSSIGTPGDSYANNTLYSRPDPGRFAAANFPALCGTCDLHLALVHAGFMQDQAVLKSLAPPFLLQGGHDHLRFAQPLAGGQGMHLHAGCWSNSLAIVGINFTGGSISMRVRQLQLTRSSPTDLALAAMLTDARATLLNDGNNPVVGTASQAYDLNAAVLRAVDVVRAAADADIGFLSHTTFGDGLPAGMVRQLDLDAFIRFPGGFKTATLSGATLLNQVLPITNQFGDFPYAQRTGDYVYTTADPASIDPSRSYRCVINGFAASAAYLGGSVPAFVDGTADASIAGLELRSVVGAALADGTF